jgi:phenylacetate-CoA ligase
MPENFPDRLSIAQRHLEHLRALLAAILPANRFYAQKFSAAGITGKISTLNQFIHDVPFTFKQELAEDQRAHPPFGTNLTFALERYTRCHQTSGTAGAPLRWLDTPESWDWMLASWEQIHRLAGVTPADRVFFAFSFGPFIGFWLAFEAALRIGCLCLPGGGLSSVARVRAILDQAATVLCCTPTYAIRLAEVASAQTIDLAAARVKTIIVAGEPGGSIPSTRGRLEQLWPGARVFDHHGMTEVGPVTYQCPARPGVLHVMESAYIAEVVDLTTGQTRAPAQAGELVLTTLGRTGSPLLRYRTGDLVKPALATVCQCGRSELALEGGILGRTDEMVVVRGVNVYPSAVEEIIRACGGVAEYQVQVSTAQALTELSVQVEPSAECTDVPDLVRKLEGAFQAALALRVPVSSVAPGTLPRLEMKARRWVKSGSA